MSGKLAGRTALITGASKGLGKAMATALAEEGTRVGLVSRDRTLLDAVAAEIGANAIAFQTDVTSEEQVRKLETDVKNAFGRVDILINNAGINCRKNIT